MFKEAVGSQGRNFVRGTTHIDAHKFLRHVTTQHYRSSGLLLRYTFKRMGYNKEWDMGQLYKNLCTKGKYIMFGATHKNNASHHKIINDIHAKESDVYKMEHWINEKPALNNHAIGVEVDEFMVGTIYDNGCIGGTKQFTIDNLCLRMRWINECYRIDMTKI